MLRGYSSIHRNERYFLLCNSKEVENEYHIVINCDIYSKERKTARWFTRSVWYQTAVKAHHFTPGTEE